MLSPTVDTWRLVLHVLAAAVWVGGQLTLAGLVPTVRATAPEATSAVAHAFSRVAWPAYVVLVASGVWNLTEVNVSDTSTEYQVTVFVKVLLAAASGVATAVHQFGRTRAALAVGGAVGLLTSLGALFLGVLLGSGT